MFLCFRASTRVVRSDFRACLREEWWVTSREISCNVLSRSGLVMSRVFYVT